MPTQGPGGQGQARPPAMYEDRTLFATPVGDNHGHQQPPGRTGLSGAGVLLVAALAAAVAAGIVWGVLTMTGSADARVVKLTEQNDDLKKRLEEIEKVEYTEQITALNTTITDLKADIAERKKAATRYREIENLETDIAARLATIANLVAQPERSRMSASAKDVKDAPGWIPDAEQALRDHLAYLDTRVEQITTWPIRNPPPPCSDPENC